MARLFDNVDDQILVGSVSQWTFIKNTAVFTIAMWVKFTDHAADDLYGIIANINSSNQNGFGVWFDNRTGVFIKKLRLLVVRGVAGDPVIDSNSSDNFVTDNNWHMLGVVCNGTNAFFWRDTTSETGSDVVGTLGTGDNDRAPTWGRVNGPTPDFPLNGSLAEAAIWDVALTDDQMRMLAGRRCALRVRPDRLVATGGYWPFYGTGSPEPDLSGRGNNGTVTGAVVADHAPVAPAFTFGGGWPGAFTAAAAAGWGHLTSATRNRLIYVPR